MKKIKIDYGAAVTQFERAIKKFNVKKVIYRTLFRGKGLEFDKYRNFKEGEDAEMIV